MGWRLGKGMQSERLWVGGGWRRHLGVGMALPQVAIGLALMGGVEAAGAFLNIANPSFEADVAQPASFPVLVPSGWTLLDPSNIVDQTLDAVGVVNPTGSTFFQSGVPDGSNAALIYLSGDRGGGEVSLTQTLSDTLQLNTRYRLSVEVGNIASGFGAPPFDQFFDLDGFPGYRVQLRSGNTVIGEDANSLGLTLAEGTFGTSVVDVTIGSSHPAAGQPISIRLTNLNQPGTADAPGIEVDFDLVRLEATAVPESEWFGVLAALGMGAWAVARRQGMRDGSR